MLLYRISMKLRRHLFAACLLLCTAIFVLSYMGLHNGRSTNLKPIREKMEWFKERKFLANDNITSAIREITSVLEDDNPFNKSRRLNAVAGKEKFSARLPSVSRDKEDTSKSQSVPLSSATQVRLIAGANRVDAVNRHSNISQIVLSDAETATPASKLRGESELHQGPLKTKQLQGSIQRQHELFIKAYKDLQHRNELLEKGVTQERRQQQQPPQGRDSNGGQSHKELSKNKTDLHEGSKQSFNTINKIRGGKFDEQNQAIGARGSRFRDGSAKQEERGLRIMEQSGSQHLHGNSIKKDQSSSINALRGDSKIRDQRGSVIGLQSDFNIRDRVGQINGINGGDSIHVENVGAEVKQTARSIQSGQRNSLAIKNVQILPSNDTSGRPGDRMMQLPESRNLAPFENKNEKNGTKQVDFAKPSFKDTQKMGESLVPHSMWSFRDDINSYSDLVKKVVHENDQRANHRKASILDKYVFPVKHANSEDNKRTMGEDGYQKHRFHDGLQNFEPDHHVLQLDRSPKELVYKFQSDTDNINHGDSESTRPETCKGCMNLGFTYLVNGSTICQKGRNGLDLLILVASDPVNELARTAIRSTWGRICRRPDSNIACVFMIANTPNLYLNQQVFKESLKHEDIVIFSFMDAYTNLTFKSLMGLRWSQQFCPQASYIMKTDEDVYVNTHQIPIMLRAAPSEGFVGGFCWGQSRPSRDPSNKWHVSYNQYAREFFPPMCSGTGYILSHDLVISILKVSPNIPFFNLEDVYIAFCFQELGILPINIQGFSNMRTDFQSCEYKYYVMTSHQISEMEMIDFWEEIQTCPDHAFSPQELYNPLMLPDLTE